MKQLYVVGLGPGEADQMTGKAVKALNASSILIGYTVYIDLVKDIFPGKEYLTTPMTKETERCRMALEEADKGHVVSMVCSGDSGIYGMASLIYELSEGFPEVEITVIPGITAACAGRAVLGAPLTHDFAVISLSDLLTPKEQIEKRLHAAASSDMVICLYNPSSKKRKDYLRWACDIILKYQPEDLVCGYVQNIAREGENSRVLTLKELRDAEVDMFTTVFIGNSATKAANGKMVTPRGYHI